MSSLARQSAILKAWFGKVRDANYSAESLQQSLSIWFGRGRTKAQVAAFDSELRESFGEDLKQAAQGTYDPWAQEPNGLLALCVLCDQIGRNIHRGTSSAFALDDKMVSLVRQGVEKDLHLQIHIMERSFIFLPLMHSEKLDDHDLAEQLFQSSLKENSNELFTGYLTRHLEYEKMHRDIIKRFGRYPHRNASLGRESTEEEVEFLKNAPNFGQ